jgi:putative ABC transport system ATP-binding protein
MDNNTRAPTPQGDNPLARLAAIGVSKRVESPEGSLTIIDDISFSVLAAQAVAVVGVSGSGKSTLLALLAGLDLPTAGRVVQDGVDLTTLTEDERARLRAASVGFVFQSFHLLPNLTALENVMLPLELAGRSGAEMRAREILKRVGLHHRAAHYPRQLSGGEQQRVAIARAYATMPRVLFADEPTGNLDRGTASVVGDLMFSLIEEAGTTLVLVTHDMTLASRCQRRLTLEGGRLVAEQ